MLFDSEEYIASILSLHFIFFYLLEPITEPLTKQCSVGDELCAIIFGGWKVWQHTFLPIAFSAVVTVMLQVLMYRHK
jgi:hypothetical protein